MYFVYLIRCADGSLYCGTTNNLQARLASHNRGTGSKYVRSRGGGVLVYSKRCRAKNVALKREAVIKKLDKISKEKLIIGRPKSLTNHRNKL